MRRLILAATAVLCLSIASAAASPRCFLEASAGKNITSTRIGDDITGPFTIAADGLVAGLGAGCDYELAVGSLAPVVGVIGRYDFQDVSTGVFFDRAKVDGVWSAAGKLGFKLNPSVEVYGLAGVAGTKITLGAISKDRLGLLLGAGVDIDLAVRNLSLLLEFNRVQWDRWAEIGASIRPDSDVVRAGVRLKLGATAVEK